MTIRVHVACDDKSYRDAIAAILNGDAFTVVDKGREAQQGLTAVQNVTPDVVVLAVPPNEDVATHTRAYQAAAPEGAAIVAFCIVNRQEAEYRRAGVEAVVRRADTADMLRQKVLQAHRLASGR